MISQKQVIIKKMDTEKVAEFLGTSKVYMPAELAQYLQVTVQTLHNWRKIGILDEPARVGNYTFWKQESVERLKAHLEERKRKHN